MSATRAKRKRPAKASVKQRINCLMEWLKDIKVETKPKPAPFQSHKVNAN